MFQLSWLSKISVTVNKHRADMVNPKLQMCPGHTIPIILKASIELKSLILLSILCIMNFIELKAVTAFEQTELHKSTALYFKYFWALESSVWTFTTTEVTSDPGT